MDLTRAVAGPHPGGVALDDLGLADPAREQQARRRVAQEHLQRPALGDLGVAALLVGHRAPRARTPREEQRQRRRQRGGEPALALRDAAEDAPGAGELGGVLLLGDVHEPEAEQLDRPPAGGAEGHERAALADELLHGHGTLRGEPAGVLVVDGAFLAPLVELAAADGGNDQDIDEVAEPSRPQHLVAHGDVGDLDGVQDPACPALVHVAAPRRVEADPRQAAEDVGTFLLGGHRPGKEQPGGVALGQEGHPLAGGEALGNARPGIGAVHRPRALGGAGQPRVAVEVPQRPGVPDALQLHSGGERLHDLDAAHAQEQRQRPAGDVVGRLALGVALHLEEVLDVCAVGLVATDHQGAGRVAAAVGDDRFGALVDLDAAVQEHVHQALHRGRVAVVGGDQPRPRGSRRALVYHPLGDLQGVAQPGLRLAGEAAQQRATEGQLVVDDVAQPPPAARPGVGEAVGGDVLAEAAGGGETLLGQEHRRGDAHRGRLGEQPDDVVAHGNVAVAAVPPHVVRDAGRDP